MTSRLSDLTEEWALVANVGCPMMIHYSMADLHLAKMLAGLEWFRKMDLGQSGQ
jgi:hypothetical protein